MKTYKIVLIIAISIFVLIIILFGYNFSPGSYANIKKYKFNISEDNLINNIHKLKEMDTSLNVPNDFQLIEGRKDNNDLWFHFYIYYSDEKEIIKCWVRGNTKTSSTLGVVSILDKYGKWRVIDRDLNSEEREIFKIEFEKRVISRLKKYNE